LVPNATAPAEETDGDRPCGAVAPGRGRAQLALYPLSARKARSLPRRL